MLINNKIIAVLTINDSTKSLDLIKCLKNVGISNLDIRLRTNESKKAIETIVNSNYDFNIGVGTVVSTDDLAFINSLKIKYAFSPHTDEKIIRLSNKYNIEFIPGVSTLSDINSALDCGCQYLKFFPAEKLGGVNYLDSILKPLKKNDLKIIAMGGINDENISEYLSHENIIGIGSSWIANEILVNDSNWTEIERRAKLLLNK